MLSQIPVDFNKVKKENLNNEILRAAIIGELDAINLYERLAAARCLPIQDKQAASGRMP